jgi:hypothetical protein
VRRHDLDSDASIGRRFAAEKWVMRDDGPSQIHESRFRAGREEEALVLSIVNFIGADLEGHTAQLP